MQDKPSSESKPTRVEVQFLEALRRRCPSHEPILEALGHLYTRVGRYQDGLQVDLELTQLKPDDPESWYNLACSQALTGHPDAAMTALDRAVVCGYDDAEWLSADPDLNSLRTRDDFERLVRQVQQKAGARWNAQS